jgi:hypothetical protein
MKKIFGGCVALLALTGLPLCAGNLLTNGGFEKGDFSFWSTGGNFEDTEVVTGPFYAYSSAQEGSYYGVLGPVGSDATLSQTIADSVGNYTFSFWVNAVGDDPSDFSASWNGTQLLSVSDPNTGGLWTKFSYSVAGTGSDIVSFAFRDDPEYIALDNVSVASSSATPEPATFGLLGGALIVLAVSRLRRRGQITPLS